jgi:small subunit ribosomal protein S6
LRRYETIFILRPDLGENQIQETIKRFEGVVGAGGGETIETEEWGSRELAFQIRGERRGYYVRLDYAAGAAVVNEIERNLKLQDTVLRYLSVMTDPEPDVAKARDDLEARKRRIAEAKAAAEARATALAAEHEHAAAQAATGGESEAPAQQAPPAEQAAPAEPEEPREPEGGGKPD